MFLIHTGIAHAIAEPLALMGRNTAAGRAEALARTDAMAEWLNYEPGAFHRALAIVRGEASPAEVAQINAMRAAWGTRVQPVLEETLLGDTAGHKGRPSPTEEAYARWQPWITLSSGIER
jgi:hypothetical protein